MVKEEILKTVDELVVKPRDKYINELIELFNEAVRVAKIAIAQKNTKIKDLEKEIAQLKDDMPDCDNCDERRGDPVPWGDLD